MCSAAPLQAAAAVQVPVPYSISELPMLPSRQQPAAELQRATSRSRLQKDFRRLPAVLPIPPALPLHLQPTLPYLIPLSPPVPPPRYFHTVSAARPSEAVRERAAVL